MKIAIEAQRIMRKDKHGMDFVIIEVIRQLQKIDSENEYYIMVGKGDYPPIEESRNFHIVRLNAPSYPLWEQVALPAALLRIKPDVVHCTSNTAPLYCPFPLVLTLHDVIFLEPQTTRNTSTYQSLGRRYRRFVVPRIINNCRKIITVSDYERQRIANILPQSAAAVLTFVYNGYNEKFTPKNDWQSKVSSYFSLDFNRERYIFFLGNTDPKKNTEGTILGYANYVKRSQNPAKLVIADYKQVLVDEILMNNGLESLRDNIITLGYIANDDLPYIYSGAMAFLYTSLRESFGIPLLEAMSSGVPVVSSCTSAIPEVAGSGAMLVDPTSPGAIGEALWRIENEPELRQQIIDYGKQRVKLFSWENSARRYLEIYRETSKK